MRRLIALLMGLLAAPGVAQTCSSDPPGNLAHGEAEAYIRHAERDWAASIARDETAFLTRYTAPDFVAVFDGKVITRARLIADAAKRQSGTATNQLETLRVHLFGATAVAEGSEVWSEATATRRRRIVWSDFWVRCGGGWRLVTSTSVGSPM